MNIAFCYESVVPARGGCETYIADLARRLVADRHQVHVYASTWDAQTLPKEITFHPLRALGGPRFLRPWRFSRSCLNALRQNVHDVTVGFDKTWGQDILYPQAGLHLASTECNLRKHRWGLTRWLARGLKKFDLAAWSYARLERRQYMTEPRPLIVVNSELVRGHFRHYYPEVPNEEIHVVRSAIDLNRFTENDRPRSRLEFRREWNIPDGALVGLFAAMNYRLKGLDPLLNSLRRMLAQPEFVKAPPVFHLVVAGNPKTNSYRRLAQRLGVEKHVIFVGHRQDMRACYFAADFFVHPTFYDTCSLVVLEALACALPVITTSYSGVSELLKDAREGYVISDPHDHDKLAWCMRQFFDADIRAACSRAARRTAAQWTFEHHYRQILGVFAEAMARNEAIAA